MCLNVVVYQFYSGYLSASGLLSAPFHGTACRICKSLLVVAHHSKIGSVALFLPPSFLCSAVGCCKCFRMKIKGKINLRMTSRTSELELRLMSLLEFRSEHLGLKKKPY